MACLPRQTSTDRPASGAMGFSVILAQQLALDGVEPVSQKSVWEVSSTATTFRSI